MNSYVLTNPSLKGLSTEKINFDLKEKNLQVLKKRLELTKEQFDIGEVTLTDVSIAEARYLLAQSELIESEKNINTLLIQQYPLLFQHHF